MDDKDLTDTDSDDSDQSDESEMSDDSEQSDESDDADADVVEPVCGNEAVETGEDCDNGYEQNGNPYCAYGETDPCTVCTIECKEAAGQNIYCGDGVVQRADCTGYDNCEKITGITDEECDPGDNAACLLDCSGLDEGKRIYVNAVAAGANNGTTWVDAYTDLQRALDDAEKSIGDGAATQAEIWVAGGTYKPSFAAGNYCIRLRGTNGWYGAALKVTIGGTVVHSGLTLASGTQSPWYNFTVESGQSVAMTYTSNGTWPEQIWFEVRTGSDGNGAAYFATIAGKSPPQPFGNRHKHFSLVNNTTVYGGFLGNETDLSQRKLPGDVGHTASYVAYLSGDHTGADTQKSYNVFRHNGNGVNSSAVLDGVTITGGRAYPEWTTYWLRYDGEGMLSGIYYCEDYDGCWPTNSVFIPGPQWMYARGAAMANYASDKDYPTLNNVTVENCSTLNTADDATYSGHVYSWDD